MKYGQLIETIGKYSLIHGLKRIQIRDEHDEIVDLAKNIKQARNIVNALIKGE